MSESLNDVSALSKIHRRKPLCTRGPQNANEGLVDLAELDDGYG